MKITKEKIEGLTRIWLIDVFEKDIYHGLVQNWVKKNNTRSFIFTYNMDRGHGVSLSFIYKNK